MPLIDTLSGRSTAPSNRYDTAIIGGGVNGAGAFRDLAMRGAKVILLEKDDFGAGTSGASSSMIHGGLRYLLSEPSVTKESCKDAGVIRTIASHLVFRIPFLYPILRTRRLGRGLLFVMDAVLFGYDFYARHKEGLPHLLFSGEALRRIEPALTTEVVGGISFDEWGVDAARLCWLLARSGEVAGGKAFNHARVERIQFIPPREGEEGYFVLDVNHHLEKRTEKIETRTVLNAAGPWGPLVAKSAGANYRLRPAKGVHLVLDRRITNYAVIAQAADGREIFLEPWGNLTLIGTTDDDYYGDLDDIPVTHDEVEYLLQGIETVLPCVRRARIISTWVGVRPTLYNYGCNEDKLSRNHRIIDHAPEGLPGMWSIAGGKLASFRLMAEEAADRVCTFLRIPTASRTAETPLPGSEEQVDIRSLSIYWSVEPYVMKRMVCRHGSLVRRILLSMHKIPSSRSLACMCEPVTEAEILYSIKFEKAATLNDLMRRTRFGTGPCGASRCALRVAAIMGRHLDWDAKTIRTAALDFIQNQYHKRRPAIRGAQARQEMITLMSV